MVKVCMIYLRHNEMCPFWGNEISSNAFTFGLCGKMQTTLVFISFVDWGQVFCSVSCFKCSFHECRMLFCSITPSITICCMAILAQHQKMCTPWQSWQESTMLFFECLMVTTPKLVNEASSSQVGP